MLSPVTQTPRPSNTSQPHSYRISTVTCVCYSTLPGNCSWARGEMPLPEKWQWATGLRARRFRLDAMGRMHSTDCLEAVLGPKGGPLLGKGRCWCDHLLVKVLILVSSPKLFSVPDQKPNPDCHHHAVQTHSGWKQTSLLLAYGGEKANNIAPLSSWFKVPDKIIVTAMPALPTKAQENFKLFFWSRAKSKLPTNSFWGCSQIRAQVSLHTSNLETGRAGGQGPTLV